MNITNCPQCGGRVRSVSIGWKCESCHGFIDMRGEFHQHKEEPFMPPMTNADRIRSMGDEELAYQFGAQCPKGRKRECDKRCSQCWLEWLQQPCEGE